MSDEEYNTISDNYNVNIQLMSIIIIIIIMLISFVFQKLFYFKI